MPRFSAERWRALDPHLDDALRLAPEARAAWLASLRAADPALADDLQALLDERDALSREGFLAAPLTDAADRPSLAGQVVGSYTLATLIGRGGMGSVWLARRSDGRFEGVAAVKLLNAELVGRTGGERFRREGAILARLNHPHIAHLLDAGVLPHGQPYLVLEHVEGEPIDRFCDRRGLGVRARTVLFLDVLAAVAHAHANLVVHRDLKPSNVLVRDDGQVKLLDFGIAKLLETEGMTESETALTREGGRALTPEYAAPEQLTGGPITTATDVYSLGVLLFQLLASRHPAGDLERPPAELLHAIVEDEPPRVSEAAALAEAGAGWSPALRGDLDTIVAKALRKDPAERYPSVLALADDLRRHLADQPIRARAEPLRSRAAKFVRRNRLPVALSALAAAALVAGAAATVAQARRATRQAEVAEAERQRADKEALAAGAERDFALGALARAEAINDLNEFLLSDAGPSGRPFTAGELLARAEKVLEKDAGMTDAIRAEMLVAIGRQLQMHNEDARARRLLASAYEVGQRQIEPAVRAKAACALASAVGRTGEYDRAEVLLNEAQQLLPSAPRFASTRAFCHMRAGEVARERGDTAAALERTLAARRAAAEVQPRAALLDLRTGIELAEAYRSAGRDRDASRTCAEAYALLVSLGRDGTETAGTLLNNWGLSLNALGQPREAERMFRRAVRIGSRDGTDAGVSPMLLANLASSLIDLGRLEEARVCASRAYEKARRAGDQVVVAMSLSRLVMVDRRLGDLDRCARELEELHGLWRGRPPGHIVHAVLASYRSLLASARGDLPAARAEADLAIARAKKSGEAPRFLPAFLLRRSEIELAARRLEPSRADAAAALALEQAAAGPDARSCRVGWSWLGLSRALRALGRADEAKAAARSAIAELEPTLGAGHAEAREARRLAGDERAGDLPR